MPEILTIKVKG